MAAGEYVSVSSQRDAELADLRLERRELEADPEGELAELASIYEGRGLSPQLALRVAEELSRGTGWRLTPGTSWAWTNAPWPAPSRPRGPSAVSFAAGAILPLLAVGMTPAGARIAVTVGVTLVALALLRGPRRPPRRRARGPRGPARRRLGGDRNGPDHRDRRARGDRRLGS